MIATDLTGILSFDTGEELNPDRGRQCLRDLSGGKTGLAGVGESHPGARAALDLLKSANDNLLHKKTPDIYLSAITCPENTWNRLSL